MAEQKKGTSRRAQRRARERAEAKANKSSATSQVEEDDDESEYEEDDEPEEDEHASGSDSDSDDEEEEEEEQEGDEEEGENIADIRDRNRRLRARSAAKRKRKRERQREAAEAVGLDAGEMAEDILARSTHQAATFMTRNSRVLQWGAGIALLGAIGFYVYSWTAKTAADDQSDNLLAAVAAESGRIGNPADTEVRDPTSFEIDPRPVFRTEDDRLKAQVEGYSKIASAKGPAGTLAQMGLASSQLDQAKYDEAKTSYEKVAASELAKTDEDLKARAIEGVGLCQDAKKDHAGALASFEKLQKLGGRYHVLGLLHQARVHYAKGDTPKSKEILAQAMEKMKDHSKYGGYLYMSALTLMARVDPAQSKLLEQKAQTDRFMEAIKRMNSGKKGKGGAGLAKTQNALGELMKSMNLSPTGSPIAPAPPTPAPAPGPDKAPSPAPKAPAPKAPAPKAPAPAPKAPTPAPGQP